MMKRLVLAAALALAFGSTSGCSGDSSALGPDKTPGSDDARSPDDAAPSSETRVDATASCGELGSADCNNRADCQALYCPNCNLGQSFIGCERQGGGELSCNARPCPSSSQPL
jgi:hypothetical protein